MVDVVPEQPFAKCPNDDSTRSRENKDPVRKTPAVTCISFNQDGTSMVMATVDGFRVFDLSANGEITMAYDFDGIPKVTLIQRLYSSNLVAFVTATDPEVVYLFNMRRNEVVCQHRYGGSVHWLALNRVRVVVAVDTKVFIQKTRNMEVIHTIPNVGSNPGHVYASATYELRSIIVFPNDLSSGTVSVYDLDSLRERHRIPAHRAAISALSVNEQVTRLATCSAKGTVIRLFDVISGCKLHELRRGIRVAAIHCLAFSRNGEFLGCSSEHETIHVFRIPTNEQRAQAGAEQGWLTSVGWLATQATGLVCSEAERYMLEERAFFTLQNPYHGIRTELNVISTFDKPDVLRLQICAASGFLNGFVIAKKGEEWTYDFQKAFFVTETVRRNNAKPVHAELQLDAKKTARGSRKRHS